MHVNKKNELITWLLHIYAYIYKDMCNNKNQRKKAIRFINDRQWKVLKDGDLRWAEGKIRGKESKQCNCISFKIY